jgi:hypothetical protein
MLTVLSGLAEFERELIRARTGEGRSRAKARGVRFGRPPKLTAHQRQEAFQRLANGEMQADIARTYAVHPLRSRPNLRTAAIRRGVPGADISSCRGRDASCLAPPGQGQLDRTGLRLAHSLDHFVGAGEQRGAGPSGHRLRATDDGPRHLRMYPLTLDGAGCGDAGVGKVR